MATYNIYKMTFTSPLHLSRGKMDTYESSETMLHSDALKSAIYVAARQICSAGWADTFIHDIRISSAFPFDAKGCYLPMPLSYHPTIEADDRKEFKKVKYLTINQFEAIAKGEKPELLSDKKAIQPDVWKRDTTQRVKINDEGDSTPFYLEKLYPKENTGLYFMVENLSDEDKKELDTAMRFLSETGIGLQRNLGNGQFECTTDTLTIALAESRAMAWVNLSLYHPKDENELSNDVLENGFYQFKKRGGWISSPAIEDNISLRKKSIMMFTEGSVFPFESIDNKGIVEDVKPSEVELKKANKEINHPIWRDGKAIFLPISI